MNGERSRESLSIRRLADRRLPRRTTTRLVVAPYRMPIHTPIAAYSRPPVAMVFTRTGPSSPDGSSGESAR